MSSRLRSVILTLENATPRCKATVRLVSRAQRPYVFAVTVTGEFPHAHRRVYPIAADSDNSAALKGMELFVAEFGRQIPGVGSSVPKAKIA
jgi:hypothetical protein